MHLEKQLYRESRTGSTLAWKILVEDRDNKVQRIYGHKDGKLQHTEEIKQGKNIGRANETTPHQQAVKDALALIEKKEKEGFREILSNPVFSFNPLPTGFCPSKPISEPPPGVTMESGYEGYFAERKYNGVNLLKVVDLSGYKHIYTRGIDEITSTVKDIAEIKEFFEIPVNKGTMTSFEFIYFDKDGRELPKELRGFTEHSTNKEKVEEKYKNLAKSGGHLEIKIFDILFANGKDITKMDYSGRRGIMQAVYFDKYPHLMPWNTHALTKENIEHAVESGWEGFVLRNLTGDSSHIEYTMNHKPYRRGAWKFKFMWTEDYFIYEFMTSAAGKYLGLPARFHLGKVDLFGNIIDCGWCGPGKLGIQGLKEIGVLLGWANIDKLQYSTAYRVSPPLTVEMKYRARQPETNSLEHPVILETRQDKPWTECLIGDEPQLYK